jgi:hypothetical protein
MPKKSPTEQPLDQPPGEFAVGYGRPPRWTQFRPGQSGNPAGRPRPKSPATLARAVLDKKVPVGTGAGRRKMSPVQEIALDRLGDKARRGDQRSFAYLLKLAGEQSASEAAPFDGAISPQDLEIIRGFLERQREETSNPDGDKETSNDDNEPKRKRST